MTQNPTRSFKDYSEAELAAFNAEEMMELLPETEGEPWTDETLREAIMVGVRDFEAGRYRKMDKAYFDALIDRAIQDEEAGVPEERFDPQANNK